MARVADRGADRATGQRSNEPGAQSRRRILDAAEQLIAERGFEKTSIAEISRVSGVSRGSIPWHFTNKDGVLLAVAERATERFLEVEMTPENATVDGVFLRYEQLTRGGGAHLLLAVLQQATTTTGAVRQQYQQFYANERQKLARWLTSEGMQPGPAESLASAVLAALVGAMVMWSVDPDGVDLRGTLHSLLLMIQDHVRIATA